MGDDPLLGPPTRSPSAAVVPSVPATVASPYRSAAGDEKGARTRRARGRLWLLLLALVVVGAPLGLTLAGPHELRWRAQLFWGKLLGDYRDIPLACFVRWLRPHSPVDLHPLLENHTARAAILNTFTDEAAATEGAKIYAVNCARCHGDKGTGGVAPSLVASLGRLSDWTYFATAKWGRPGTLMIPQPLTDRQIWLTHAHVRHLVNAASRAAGQSGVQRFDVKVDAETLLAATEGDGDWLSYAGSYNGHRHSRLAQIAKPNVGALRLAFSAQFHTAEESIHATPIAAGGLLFVSLAGGRVTAIDARSGRTVWEFLHELPAGTKSYGATGNRGVAILGDSLYVATIDAHLLAIEASTGRLRWDIKVAAGNDLYTMTAAPLAVRDRVIVGVGGGDYGARGFLAAFSAADGRRLWQFDTVPGPGQFGHETWAGDSWKNGGSGTWVTGAYDKDLDLVYWGVGNAAPVYRPDLRAGDDLFSSSAIALDLATGELRWHFQFTPADEHDYDSAQQPIVADIEWQGKTVPALLWANRNAFFYALDRRDGRFLFAKPFAKQNWSKGFEPNGRPISNPAADPSAAGTLVWPWVGGATNWQPPSYDAERGLVFVPTIDAAALFFRDDSGLEHGQVYRGGASRLDDNEPATAAVRAIDARTGAIRWEGRLERGLDVYTGIGGVLSTAGGLTLIGYRDELVAFDSDGGQELWRVRLGGAISAAPVAYAIDGQQFIAITAGRSLFVFTLPAGSAGAPAPTPKPSAATAAPPR
jgi:alcohol dehydrogenase (cytochrome c)